MGHREREKGSKRDEVERERRRSRERKKHSGNSVMVARAVGALMSAMIVVVVVMTQEVNAQDFEFGATMEVERNQTMLVSDVCWQAPALSAEDLIEQQAVLEEQLQANFFLFLPCALGGANNAACCENIENQLGPYIQSPLHNCLCLPGAWQTLVDGTTGVGTYNVSDIFYGCRA